MKNLRTMHDSVKYVHDNFSTYFTSTGEIVFRSCGNLLLEHYYTLSWDTFKPVQIVIHDDYFELHVFVNTWEQVDIPYDIGRGEFDQLQFAYNIGTLKYKTIKYLKGLRYKMRKRTRW